MLRLDKILFSSELPSYINTADSTANLTVSGSVANGATVNFTAVVTILSTTNRCDLYGTNQNTITKQLLSNTGFPAIYQNKAGENAQQQILYGTGTITYILSIFNGTGSPITLTSQVIALEVIQYSLPI